MMRIIKLLRAFRVKLKMLKSIVPLFFVNLTNQSMRVGTKGRHPTTAKHPADESLQRKRTDADFTEPFFAMFKYALPLF